MGNKHIRWFSGFPDVDIVALCDVNQLRLDKTRKNLSDLSPNSKAETFTDFRYVIDRKDIDVITCATPDHWHALIAVMAFQSGKDVYGEKPLSYCKEEGDVMKNAPNHYGSVFQLGTQIHEGENYSGIAKKNSL